MPKRASIESPYNMSHLMPVRLRIEDMKDMSDAELLAVLNGEGGPRGMMTGQTAQLIASELQARAIDRASKPHWSTVPSFWLLVISAIAACIAAYPVLFQPAQVPQPVAVTVPPAQTIPPASSKPTSSKQASSRSPPTQPAQQRK